MLSTLGYQAAFPLSLNFLHLYSQKLNTRTDTNAVDESLPLGTVENGQATVLANTYPTSTEYDTMDRARLRASSMETSLECDEDVDCYNNNNNDKNNTTTNMNNCSNHNNDYFRSHFHTEGTVDEAAVLANYIIDNALLYADSLRFPPSLQAATALSLSRCLPGKEPFDHKTSGGTSYSGSANVSSDKWVYAMDPDIAEISGYNSEISLDCAKFFLLSLASSKCLGSQFNHTANANTNAHLEAIQKKYQQLSDSESLRTRKGKYIRVGDGSDLATIAQKILTSHGWCS